MGQYRLGQRILQQKQGLEPERPIIVQYHMNSGLARIILYRKQCIENRIGLGIYLVEINDNYRSVHFIRELREVKNPKQISITIPKALSKAFKHRQRVNITLIKLNRDGFFEMIRNSMVQLFDLDSIELKENKLLMQIKGKELEFIVSNYRYQKQHGYAGAYITFEGPLPAKHSYKITYDGYGKPDFRLLDGGNNYRSILNILYDPELLLLNIKYRIYKTKEHTKTLRLGERMSSTLEIKQYIERYYQAKLKGLSREMGAIGAAIAVNTLKDMGYKVVWADTVFGNSEGPDISLFDGSGNTITSEVKSTSTSYALNVALNKAIYDIETFYFDRTHAKFLWHSESDKLVYEADYALAIAIYLDRIEEAVDIKMRKIIALVNEDGVMFEITPFTWRKDQSG